MYKCKYNRWHCRRLGVGVGRVVVYEGAHLLYFDIQAHDVQSLHECCVLVLMLSTEQLWRE